MNSMERLLVLHSITERRFFPRLDQLEHVLDTDPTIALIIINSPCNPSGAVYPEAVLRQMADIIRKHPEVPHANVSVSLDKANTSRRLR